MPDATVFHFAGHTQAQPGHSGLLLAPESADAPSSVLTSDNLATRRLPLLRLAVLSACSTSRDASDTNESGSLPSSFLGDGVPNVIATRWEVDSAATAAFMRTFYQSIVGGEEVPASVAFSMRQIRAVAQYSHPYFWAGFDSFGCGADS